jgi:hypothetical protein
VLFSQRAKLCLSSFVFPKAANCDYLDLFLTQSSKLFFSSFVFPKAANNVFLLVSVAKIWKVISVWHEDQDLPGGDAEKLRLRRVWSVWVLEGGFRVEGLSGFWPWALVFRLNERRGGQGGRVMRDLQRPGSNVYLEEPGATGRGLTDASLHGTSRFPAVRVLICTSRSPGRPGPSGRGLIHRIIHALHAAHVLICTSRSPGPQVKPAATGRGLTHASLHATNRFHALCAC